MKPNSLRLRSIAVAAGMMAAAVHAVDAFAITSNTFTYSAPVNGYVMIDAMDMAPASGTAAQNFSIDFFAGLTRTDSTRACYSTGLKLPHNAKLVDIRVFYISNETSDIDVYYMKKSPTSGVAGGVQRTIVNDAGARRTAVIDLTQSSHRVINNHANSHGFGLCIGPGDIFLAARVSYTYTSAGD